MVARTHLVAVVALIVLLGVPAVAAVESPQDAPVVADGDGISHLQATNATEQISTVADQHPPDPEDDVLGWEDGYWYNETLDVTPDDGLNDSELDAVVARGMARVEKIRGLEFEETPPVEVIGRDTLREEVASGVGNVTDSERLLENVKYEALLMVDESTDAVGVQEANQGGGVGGFYDPESGEIKIVSENTETPQMDEITLSQELYHALQDQQFNISAFDQSTQELHNAKDGIIEGDGNYVDHLYQQRCENEWNGTCLGTSSQQAPSDFEPHLGLYQISLQPYSDGPPFVRSLHQERGWDAVNAVYENPPASTEQTIHPETYGVDEPTTVSIPDQSDEQWRALEIEDGINHASFGEAGLYVTLWYPGVESSGLSSIVPLQNHINFGPDGQVQDINPYNYNHTYTAGWDGDKLIPYVTDDSTETNETGYVYKTVWDSPDEAAEFREGYTQLLEFRNAEAVEDRENTYRIPDSESYGDAFYLDLTDETFTIVNAPSVEELSAVQEGAAPVSGETTEPTETTTEVDEQTTETDDETTTDESDDTPITAESTPTDNSSSDTATTTSGPGFTFVVMLISLVMFSAFAVRRR